MSFRLKTILGVAFIEAILLTILIAHFLHYLSASSERELITRSNTNATLFAEIAKEAVLAFDLAALETHIDALTTDPGVVYTRVLDADDRLLAYRGPPALRDLPFHADHSIDDDHNALYDVEAAIQSAGVTIGRIQAGFDIHQLHLDRQQARRTGLSLALVEMLLVAIFSAFLGLYLTRQLSALIEGSHTLAKGNLGYQLPVHGNDELAAAARAFNHMSSRLKEDNVRREAILRSSLDALITVDEFGFINDFNPAASALFRLTRKQALGMELESLFGLKPASSDLLAGLQRAVQSSHSVGGRLELEISAHDGRAFPAEISITTSDLPSGALTTLYIRDISDRLDYEEKLRKLSRVVEQSPSSILITGLDGTIEYVNPYFTQLTGYSYEEAVGNTPRIIKSGKHPPEMYQELWSTINSGQIWRGELINRKKSGELYWEHVSITPIRDRHGKVTHYIGIKEDISDLKHTEEALRRERDFNQGILHQTPSIICGITPDGVTRFINPAGEEITGYRHDELINHNLWQTLFPGEQRAQVEALLQRLRSDSHEIRNHEMTLTTKSGEPRTIAWNFIVKQENDEWRELLCFGHDISYRIEAEQQLRNERSFLQNVVDGVTEPIMVIAPDYRVLLSNRAAKLMHGVPQQDAPNACHLLAHGFSEPCRGESTPCPLAEVLQTGKPTRVVHQRPAADGTLRSHELLLSPLWNDDGSFRGVIESIRDITSHMRLLDAVKDERTEMQHLAHHDALTGLPNRLFFTLRLEQAIRETAAQDQRFALLFIDLDRFKQVNDTLGHQAGDDLLRAVARRISAAVRDQDTVARLGGDEFVVLAGGLTQPEDAGVIAGKLAEALRQPVELSGQSLQITASIGICTYPEDGIDATSLLERADTAMYRTKQSGRDGYQFFARG